MTRDLLETLAEAGMDPALFEAAAAFPPRAETQPGFAARTVAAALRADARARRTRAAWRAVAAAALSAAAAAAIVLLPDGGEGARPAPQVAATACAPETERAADGFRRAIEVCRLAGAKDPQSRAAFEKSAAAILASQRADGGWTNPLESAWCAAALAAAESAEVPGAAVARKRALRYLARNGFAEMGAKELAALSEAAAPSRIAKDGGFREAVSALRAIARGGA